MDLCDSNVWLALALSRHVHHVATRTWFDAIVEPGSVLFCRATQLTFLRLLTNATVLGAYGNPPLTSKQAWEACQSLLGDGRVAFRAEEPPGLTALWRRFAVRRTASPKLWMDAYLAAFALAGGCRLVTTDVAFRQFAGLELELLR